MKIKISYIFCLIEKSWCVKFTNREILNYGAIVKSLNLNRMKVLYCPSLQNGVQSFLSYMNILMVLILNEI